MMITSGIIQPACLFFCCDIPLTWERLSAFLVGSVFFVKHWRSFWLLSSLRVESYINFSIEGNLKAVESTCISNAQTSFTMLQLVLS